MQKLCGSRFGWPASKTLEVAQELYDGQGKKIITYPRAEVRYLPQNLISDVPRIVAALPVGQSFSTIPVPNPPIIRKGASGTFYDKGLEGASHHAVIPNVNTIDKLREVWPRLSSDEKKLFDVIARAYLGALMPDFRYRHTTATLDVRGFEFGASGRQAHRSWLARSLSGLEEVVNHPQSDVDDPQRPLSCDFFERGCEPRGRSDVVGRLAPSSGPPMS